MWLGASVVGLSGGPLLIPDWMDLVSEEKDWPWGAVGEPQCQSWKLGEVRGPAAQRRRVWRGRVSEGRQG